MQLITLSQRISGPGETVRPVDPDVLMERPTTVLPGRTCYIGHRFGQHYGHFITEGLSSIWWLYYNKDFDRIAVHRFLFGAKQADFEQLAWSRLSLSSYPVHVIDEPVIFENAIVPERIWKPNQTVNVLYRSILAQLVPHHPPTAARRIYLSRRYMPLRNIENENELEELSSSRYGFEVIYPESIPFADQLAVYSESTCLAGFAGSNMHNCIFARPGATVICIQDTRSTPIIQNQKLSDALMENRTIGITSRLDGSRVDISGIRAQLDEVLL